MTASVAGQPCQGFPIDRRSDDLLSAFSACGFDSGVDRTVEDFNYLIITRSESIKDHNVGVTSKYLARAHGKVMHTPLSSS